MQSIWLDTAATPSNTKQINPENHNDKPLMAVDVGQGGREHLDSGKEIASERIYTDSVNVWAYPERAVIIFHPKLQQEA